MPRSRELEVKLDLTSAQVRNLRGRAALSGFTHTAAKRSRLVSTYYDTRDWALRDRGLALRVRRDGDTWVQTLKKDRTLQGGVSDQIELEAVLDGPEPDLNAVTDKVIRRKLKAIARRSELSPVFQTAVERTVRRVSSASSDLVELAIDEGCVSVGGNDERFTEAEIELKSGDPRFLLDVVKSVASDGPLRVCIQSKADRGYRAAGAPMRSALAIKPSLPDLERHRAGGDVMKDILTALAAQILESWQYVIENEDIEGTHRLRVGLRRFRAGLRILATAVDDQALTSLDTELRDLARIAGNLRDADILSSVVIGEPENLVSAGEGFAAIRGWLSAEQQRRRADLLTELETVRFGISRIRLGLLPYCLEPIFEAHSGLLDRPVDELAETALAILLERVLKRGRHLSQLDVAQRHELRKSMKALRYGLDFFAPLYPKARMKRLLNCAQVLQDILGYLNDVALAENLLEARAAIGPHKVEAHFAVGAVIGWHSARAEVAWASAKPAWKRFQRAAAFIAS